MKRKSPGPTARARAAKRRKDRAVADQIYRIVSLRDGSCRLTSLFSGAINWVGPCEGRAEWAHLHSHRRSKTRGQPPDERHTEAGSVMLCTKHHRDYDAKKFQLLPVVPSIGAKGLLWVAKPRADTHEATV
jgi:hypothetical protein